jgi:hypothetical protein
LEIEMGTEKTEAQMGEEIMSMVNTMTPAKTARLTRDLTAEAGGVEPFYLNVRQISPALDMTVGFGSELAAYKVAYAYRDHWTSRVRVEKSAIEGSFLVVIQPKNQ